MKRQISVAEASDKVVQGIHCFTNGQTLIVFKDDTFCVFGVESGDYQGDADYVHDQKLDYRKMHDSQLIKIGIATQEEIVIIRREIHEEIVRQFEEKEMATFKYLSKKYGHKVEV